MPEGTFLVAYVDDIAAVITARKTKTAKTETCYAENENMAEFLDLNLAKHKTKLLLIIGCHIPVHVDIPIGNEVIGTKSSARYLGIRLDPTLTLSYQT